MESLKLGSFVHMLTMHIFKLRVSVMGGGRGERGVVH